MQDGVYVGDAVVKNHKGKAYLKFAYTNEIPITLSVSIINLETPQLPVPSPDEKGGGVTRTPT